MKRIFWLVAIIAALGLPGCKKNPGAGPATLNPDDVRLLITDRGIPTGEPASIVIGAEGGALTSADGRLTVTFPAGALNENTEVGIRPVTNLSPLGLGPAYRLSPEGMIFDKPVTLSFHYDAELIGTAVEDFLWFTTQNADGSWSGARKTVVDKTTRTVTVQAPHFSDWSMGRFVDLMLVPDALNLPVGKSTTLGITGFLRQKQNVAEEDVLVPLSPIGFELAQIDQVAALLETSETYLSFRAGEWALNGVGAPVSNGSGRLDVTEDGAKFTAPAKVPSPQTVAVSLKMDAVQQVGTREVSFQLVSNITIVESEYYLKLKAGGRDYIYYQYGPNGDVPADPDNYALVNFARNGDGSNAIAAVSTIHGQQADFFGLSYDAGGPGSRLMFCNNADTDNNDDMSFTPGTDVAGTLVNTYTKRIKKQDNCELESLCAGMSINVTRISGEGDKDVSATFSGVLYNTPAGYDKDCKSDEPYPVSGVFRLHLAN